MLNVLQYLLLILLLLRPQEVLPALAGIQVVQIVLLLALAAWMLKPDKALEQPQFRILLPLLGVMCLGVGLNGWLGGMPRVLLDLAPAVSIFLVTSMATRNLRAFNATAWLIVICSVLLVWHSAVQMSTGLGPLTNIKPFDGRPYYVGTLADPNDLGQLFAISIALAIYLAVQQQRWLARLSVVAIIGWLSYGVLLTNSRGALLAALGVLGVVGVQRFGKVAVLAVAALSIPVLLAATRLSQLNPEEESAAGRVEAWYEGMQMLRQNPLFGVGYGGFTDHNYLTAHNFLVLPIAELGLVGFTLWLAMVWYTMRATWWIAYGPHAAHLAGLSAAQRAEVRAGRAMTLALLAFGISSIFLSQSYKFQIFLLMGMAVARFISAARVLPEAPVYRIGGDLWKLVRNAIVVIIVMYVLIRVLL